MVLAVITGLVLVNLVQPGVGSDLAHSEFFRERRRRRLRKPAEGPPPLGAFLLQTARTSWSQNPVAALAAGQILPIVAVRDPVRDRARCRLGPARRRR